jgi:NAD(P)-dependent dehydrogenase (short-subunit alcohol dehydrogenase family)
MITLALPDAHLGARAIRDDDELTVDRLKDKVVLLVGATTGMGRVSAEMMAAEGAKVVVAGRTAALLDEVVSGIAAAGGQAVAARTDIADDEQVAAMVSTAVDTYGGLDVLVTNAAALDAETIGVDQVTDVVTQPVEVWERTFRVNTRGTMMCIKHAVPHMLERDGGSIVITSSASAIQSMATQGAYSASKAALHGLARHLAAAYGKRGIRCNVIAPGLILSPILETRRPQSYFDMMMRNLPNARLGVTSDIGHALIWLASEESGFVQGQCISIDGGITAVGPYYADAMDMIVSGRVDGEKLAADAAVPDLRAPAG